MLRADVDRDAVALVHALRRRASGPAGSSGAPTRRRSSSRCVVTFVHATSSPKCSAIMRSWSVRIGHRSFASGSRGRPSRRSPITLRWISLVPPAMVRQRLARKPNVHCCAAPSVVAPGGAEQFETELLRALVVLDAEQLAHARFGSGLGARHAAVRRPQPEQRDGVRLGHQRARALPSRARRTVRSAHSDAATLRCRRRSSSRCPWRRARWPAWCGPAASRRRPRRSRSRRARTRR